MPGRVVAFGREPFDRFSSWLATPGPPDHTALAAILTGAGVALPGDDEVMR